MSILIPARFKLLKKHMRQTEFKMLDVGCGSHSASITKKWFPSCAYYGIDRTRSYENDERDFRLMDGFFEIDLTSIDYDEVPNAFFDVIVMSHVIEHLQNGDRVLEHMMAKLKENGFVYLEFPSRRSTKFPHMKGSLNFYDDPTHCRLYSIVELQEVLTRVGCTIMKAEVRRQWVRILLLPLKVLYSKWKVGYVEGGVFWDLFGFADYIFAQKRRS